VKKRFIDADIYGPLSEEMSLFCDEVERVLGCRPRKWQAVAIAAIVTGRDVLVKAGTSSGKSLVFQALIVARPKATVLVISPTIALMEDQVSCVCQPVLTLRIGAKLSHDMV
jgi:ATP-dependent helicase YprA (DUF1998 family)